jgi:PAS domain S-box-containing protein
MKAVHDSAEIGRENWPEVPFLKDAEAMLATLDTVFAHGFSRPGDTDDGSLELPSAAPPEWAISYRTLLEQIPAVVFMARLEDGLSEAYVSPHIETILGFSRAEWLDDPIRWYYQIHPDDRERWSVEAAAFVFSGKPLRSLYRVLARDGRVVWFQCDVKMVRRKDGQPWFIHGVGIDVTSLKDAEEELKRARDELEIRVGERTAQLSEANADLESEIAERKRAERSLERRAEDLARSNADLEQFAYSASHDLQEPIRNVAICAQLLNRGYTGRLDPEGEKLLKTVIASAHHMENLVRDLLEYTHVTRAAVEPADLTDANKVLATVLRTFEGAIRETGADVTQGPLPQVILPAVRLQQVFQNLISNAIKYRSTRPPRIHVSASRVEGSWLFSVEDNGLGIDPKYHERIFGIFKRLHTKDQYPGTGIGLAICKRIVEHTGGRIWVQSESGKGAKFLFTVPAPRNS